MAYPNKILESSASNGASVAAESEVKALRNDEPKSKSKHSIGDISVQDVSMTFKRNGQTFTALETLSLRVSPGEFVALLGPSGCGKSTLLNVISGMLRPTTGNVIIDGSEVSAPGPFCNVVFQQHSLFPWMTVIDNVAYGPKHLKQGNPEAVARTFLNLVGLERFGDSYPSQLSGGMQQRVAIARALATYPKVLLMDEPFGALDSQTRQIMQEELLKIWTNFNTSVVFVTHDIDEAIYLADRIVIMKTAPGDIKEIITVNLERPRSPQVLFSKDFGNLRKKIVGLIREETLKVFQNS